MSYSKVVKIARCDPVMPYQVLYGGDKAWKTCTKNDIQKEDGIKAWIFFPVRQKGPV